MRCLRINERGDRRYRVADVQAFLHDAGLQTGPFQPFVSRLRPTLVESSERGALPAYTPIGQVAAGARTGSNLASLPALSSPSGMAAPQEMAGLRGMPAAVTPLGRAPRRGHLGALRPLASTALLARVRIDEPADAETLDASQRSLVERIRDQLRSGLDLDEALRQAALTLLETHYFRRVAIAEWRDGKVIPRVQEGLDAGTNWLANADTNLISVALREGRPVAVPTPVPPGSRGTRPPATVTAYAPVGEPARPWGVLIVESASDRPLSRLGLELLATMSSAVEVMAAQRSLTEMVDAQRERSEALSTITAELSSQLELPVLMQMLVQRSVPLFKADRAAIFRLADRRTVVEASQGLSQEFIEWVGSLREPPAGLLGDMHGTAFVLQDLAGHARTAEYRAMVQREGLQTVALAPLMAEAEMIGLLAVYHDRRHEWSMPDLHLLETLGAQAGIAIRNAKNYQLMATWAAQLQSIQQLGTRLNRWGTVAAIGQAIAAELRQLIDYHNVRVYRVRGDEVEPVAWRGEIGEYTDEERDQLRLKVGEGITGWVAQNGIPQYLPDAAHDPRSQTISGTEEDLDESMLIAPMLYEDQVLGVIVLSKLGVNQFTGDDLRYLEIYASIAAQAMVNADATEQLQAQSDRLARQLSSQRELMQVTESILSTLDPRTVVEEIADRLGGLLKVDNIAIGLHDPEAHLIRTLFARGSHADLYMKDVLKDTEGLGGWVLRHGEAVMIPDTLQDPRFLPLRDPPMPGSVIVAPLRSRDQTNGVLLLERLGHEAHFEEEEFELLQLFAGHVSIALQNAQAHQAVEIRAQTDALTALKNQGTFQEYLHMAVKRGNPFSLLIVDLDDFKAFNDRRGHEAGNRLLASIAKALRASCRDSDEVFRYGGDEFALILPNTDVQGAMQVAAKVGRAVRSAPAPGGRRASGVTCSIGAAAFPEDAGDGESILLAADRACYVAKRNGRNRAVTAADALALAGDVLPEGPTPVDDPDVTTNAA